MSMGTIKVTVEGEDESLAMYHDLIEAGADSAEISKKKAYDELLRLGFDDKTARAATLYYVVE